MVANPSLREHRIRAQLAQSVEGAPMSVINSGHELMLAASCMTPFSSDRAVNEKALRHQLQRFAEARLAVWLVSSGTAEANVLSDDEIDRIAEIAFDEIGGRTPLYAMGREPRSAGEALEFARRMFDRGVDTVQVGPLDPGHSYLPTDGELRRFYEEVIGSIDGSCFIATHMSVGYEVPPALLVEVAGGFDQVVGINVTHLRNYVYAPQVLARAAGVAPVYLGSPMGAIDGLLLGASGVVSSFDVNVAPRLYQEFGAAWAAHDLPRVSEAAASIMRLFLAILGSGGLVVAKAILDRLGIEAGPPRPPRREPDAAVFSRADEIIDQFELSA
jgi:4-hydroxy-tetrahydrodipicolinate synthase